MFLPPHCLYEEEVAFSSLKQSSFLPYRELTADKISWEKENLISGVLVLKQENFVLNYENSSDFPTAKIQMKAKCITEGNVKWQRTAKGAITLYDIDFLIYIYLFFCFTEEHSVRC